MVEGFLIVMSPRSVVRVQNFSMCKSLTCFYDQSSDDRFSLPVVSNVMFTGFIKTTGNPFSLCVPTPSSCGLASSTSYYGVKVISIRFIPT